MFYRQCRHFSSYHASSSDRNPLFKRLLWTSLFGLLGIAAWPFLVNAYHYPFVVRQTLRQALLHEKHLDQPEKAAALYRQAWEQAKQVGMNMTLAPATGILIALGALYEQQHQLDEAIEAYEKVFTTILHSSSDDIVEHHHSYQEMISAWEHCSAEQHRRLIGLAQKLGDLYVQVGKAERAEGYYVWSVAMQLLTTPSDSHSTDQLAKDAFILPSWTSGPDFAACLDALARFYASRQQYQRAIPILRRTLQHLPPDDCRVSLVACHLADAYVGVGDLTAARQSTERGLEVARAGRRDMCALARGALLFNRAIILEVSK
jgi:tetratricopeptide (TPR) repeat protein